ncbi:MAG: TlpA disulfide reductase family protein [Solirubrobacteraceae bacterium]|nr:TlpA disulfide reductase family protein [Patulibacter sp.]
MTRRSPVPVAVVVLAALLIAVLAYGLIGSGKGNNLDSQVQRGELPPAPKATTQLAVLGGTGSQSLAQLRGKVVVVNVWASWCPPCIAESPIIEAIQTALQKTGEGQVLGLTHDDPSEKSIAFAQKHGLTFTSLRDVDDTLYKAFGASGPPETYVIDQQGRVAAISRGAITASFANRALAATGVKARIDPNLKLAPEA